MKKIFYTALLLCAMILSMLLCSCGDDQPDKITNVKTDAPTVATTTQVDYYSPIY